MVSARWLRGAGLGLLLLPACWAGEGGGTPEPEATAPPSFSPGLEGSEWRLVQLSGEPAPAHPWVTLEIDEGRLGGFAGCNHYGAALDLAGRALTVGPIERNLRACDEPGVAALEERYLGALGAAASFQIAEGELVLEDGRGRPHLRFARRVPFASDPRGLAGTAWRLGAAGGAESDPELGIRLRFGPGDLAGFAGCRGFVGAWTAEADRFHVTHLEMTEMECADPRLHAIEGRFTTDLSEATRYRLEGDRLDLVTAAGRVIAFVRDEESAPEVETASEGDEAGRVRR